MERHEAVEWLGETERARNRTRVVSRRVWFPLLLFGVITMGTVPLYPGGPLNGVSSSRSYVGAFFVSHPERLSLYWLLASAGGYLATALYFWWQDRRSGVAIRWQPFVIVGVALYALLIAVSPEGLSLIGLPWRISPWFHVGDLFIRGLTPILTIALGLLVLAAFQRSVSFAAYSLGFVGLALLVNLYDLGNITYRMGLGDHGVGANVVTAGGALLLGGVGFAVAARRRG